MRMKKMLCFSVLVFSWCAAFEQSTPKMLFVIDSIPLIHDPEEWNQLMPEDIAEISVLSNKDSLNRVGWGELDGITYIFTKAYRERPDSLKRIPSLKQMVMQNGAWHLDGRAYTGPYIDYLYNGRIQDEGNLRDGKLNGQLTVYYINGAIKSVARYVDGTPEGERTEYYKNGALMQSSRFREGKMEKGARAWFINGQAMSEIKPKNKTGYDTVVIYYSTGKIQAEKLVKNKVAVRTKKDDDLAYYNTMFFQSVNTVDVINANKLFYRIWMLDSTSADSHFKQGYLYAKEFRFDDAIEEYDKALRIEPLLREALVHRGLARIKKYRHIKAGVNNGMEFNVGLDDLLLVPDADREKVCKDLVLADALDVTDNFVRKLVPQALLKYCGNDREKK